MEMDDIDVSLLRAFVAVAETGRMTTAAKVVNRSQGAVSQQIKRLEDQFRTPLFERHAAAVRLTRSGERLMVAAHRIIALNDEVMAKCWQWNSRAKCGSACPMTWSAC